MTSVIRGLAVLILLFFMPLHSHGAPVRIQSPPMGEKWYGIYVDNDRVGFYRQRISEEKDGYRIEADGSVRMRVMGFSKEASSRESYEVGKNLTLRSFDINLSLNGVRSRTTGKAVPGGLKLVTEQQGSKNEKNIKAKGDIFPGQALNIYPLLKGAAEGKNYKLQVFDPEDLKVKEVLVTALGEVQAPDGTPAIKLRNNLYPFVDNDIWVDRSGNTVHESVRSGLVVTKAETAAELGYFVSGVALSKRDLIFDFSIVKPEPPLKDLSRLKGVTAQISGWEDALPLLQGGGQIVERKGPGVIVIKTGESDAAVTSEKRELESALRETYLKPGYKIESDAQEILARTREVTAGTEKADEVVRRISSWVSEWIKDTVDDGGSALAALTKKEGNCQTHARLYVAMARAGGIPSRFVSGLTYMENKGFLYHSWAESHVDGRWLAVDPTYNQFPADPTHFKFFEGSRLEDLSPIIAIIGKIKIRILDVVI